VTHRSKLPGAGDSLHDKSLVWDRTQAKIKDDNSAGSSRSRSCVHSGFGIEVGVLHKKSRGTA
jgi:hypothetical protein